MEMGKGRLEAFSDGVLAIAITIMVLDLKVPHTTYFSDLDELIPVFVSYALSFIYIGIYWTNHHHMLHTVKKVTGGILWANLHLLFWLSLIPFSTGWMGENNFADSTAALYGVVLLLSALSYWILQQTIIRSQGSNSILKRAVGRDQRGRFSIAAYLVAIFLAYQIEWVSLGIYIVVALLWLIPDKRIERALNS